jgi:hypothetical protein
MSKVGQKYEVFLLRFENHFNKSMTVKEYRIKRKEFLTEYGMSPTSFCYYLKKAGLRPRLNSMINNSTYVKSVEEIRTGKPVNYTAKNKFYREIVKTQTDLRRNLLNEIKQNLKN